MVLRFQSQKVYCPLILVFLLFSISVGIAGYFFYDHQKKSLRQENWEHLSAIAELKVKQIDNWRKERLEDGEIIFAMPFIAHHVRAFLENPKSTEVKQEIIDLMNNFRRHHQYESIILLDGNGTIRLSLTEEKAIGPHAKKLIREAMQRKEVVLSDLYRSETTQAIRLSLLVPIMISQNDDIVPIGVFLLRIDPYQFLYPLIQSWPTPSRTSETLLVRQDGEEVVFLNELLHQKGTALKVRHSTTDKDKRVPAVMAALGVEGIVEEMDYRGVPVLAALRKIPGSPWFLVAKVDQEELYAPIHLRMRLIAFIIGLLIGGAGLMVGLLWRHQRAEHYKRQYQAEHEYGKLTQRYEYLTQHANDIILLMDQDLKIVEANERAVEQYGYSHEELLQLGLKDLRVPEAKPSLEEDMKKVKEQNGHKLEVFHQRKDGTRFPVENSSRVIEVDGKNFYQSIIRDVSERKRTEEILRESEKRFEELFDEAPVGYHELDRQGLLTRVNRTELEMLGYTLEEMIGQPVWKFIVEEGDSRKSAFAKLDGTLLPGRAFERNYRRKDGTPLPVLVEDRLIRDPKGGIIGIRATIQDITERKQAEEEKATLQEQLRQSQKMEAIGHLAGGIAHDFNNLLTVIKGYSQISLAELSEKDPLRENIEEIKGAADRAADLTRQLLAFSRKQIMEMQVLDLNHIVKGLDKMLHRLLGEDIDLVTVLPEGIGKVKADPGQIEQVIVNLAVNARDAMIEGGSSRLRQPMWNWMKSMLINT